MGNAFSDSKINPSVSIDLEIVLSDREQEDLTAASAILRETLQAFKDRGDTVESLHGVRGGFEILVTIAQDAATFAWVHRATLEHALNDTKTLLDTCISAATIITLIRDRHKKSGTAEPEPAKLNRFTFEKNGCSVTIEVVGQEQAKEIALSLFKNMLDTCPDKVKQITGKSPAKVKAHLPKQPGRRR